MSNADGYYIDVNEDGFGKCLVLTAPWRNELAKLMASQNITVLRLSSSAGWKDNDISFVANLDFLVGVEIYSWEVKDISSIFLNTGLRYVAIQCDINFISDFKVLKNLEICKLAWQPKIIGLETCIKLRHLNIDRYPDVDLVNLTPLTMLENLTITGSKLVSLNGAEAMIRLKNFVAISCQKLTNISALVACTELELMEFHSCKKLSELPLNISIDSLRVVSLVDCGKIKTLAPLANCKNLKKLRFIGDTSIIDGNLDFLLGHPTVNDVWYATKSHYSINREELQKRLQLKFS